MFQFSAASHVSDVGFSGLLFNMGQKGRNRNCFTYMTHFKLIYVCVPQIFVCVHVCMGVYVCTCFMPIGGCVYT